MPAAFDITDPKEAEEALRKGEGLRIADERTRSILESITDGFFALDKEWRYTFFNETGARMIGMKREDLIGGCVWELFPRATSLKFYSEYHRAVETNEPVHFEEFYPEPTNRWLECHCYPSPEGLSVFFRDITERKRVEEAFHQNEKRFQKIVESAPFGYYRLGKDGCYQYVNPEWERMHGLSGNEIVGKSIEVTEAEDNKARILEYFHRALDGQTIEGESKHILKDGSSGFHEFTIQPVYQNREIVAVEGFINDLTEQKRNEDLVRNLSHLLMQAQELERQMISYELHDRIAQNLSTLKIECSMLFDGQPAISGEFAEKIGRMSKLIELTITSVRDLAYNLRPPGLNEMSIVKAVEIYCEEFSETSGLVIDFQSIGIHALHFDYDTKLHLYRLVQEGLNNIRKHAEASRAAVKLIGASPNIILRIEDNGKGFDVKERERSLDHRKRMGLRSMQERVNLLGGCMTIRSQPMEGTEIFIKFPFKEKERDPEKEHIDR